MTTQTSMIPAETRASGNGKKPSHLVKLRHGFGKKATYERIGVAWLNDDGSIYVKLHGTQVIGEGFTLYEIKDGARDDERAGE